MSQDNTYTIVIYNDHVREAMRKDEQHPNFADDWADLRYIEMNAPDEDTIRTRIKKLYPAHQGFILVDIIIEKIFES